MSEEISQLKNPTANEEKEAVVGGDVTVEATEVVEASKKSADDTESLKPANMTGFYLGLVSTVAWIIPILGIVVTITGIVFSQRHLNSEKRNYMIAGLVLNIIFLLVSLANWIAGVILILNEG